MHLSTGSAKASQAFIISYLILAPIALMAYWCKWLSGGDENERLRRLSGLRWMLFAFAILEVIGWAIFQGAVQSSSNASTFLNVILQDARFVPQNGTPGWTMGVAQILVVASWSLQLAWWVIILPMNCFRRCGARNGYQNVNGNP